MTKKQFNDIKDLLIGTETTLHEISEEVRSIKDCYDPLDFNGENELLDNESIAFSWENEDGITEGINIIFDVTEDNFVRVTGIDTI